MKTTSNKSGHLTKKAYIAKVQEISKLMIEHVNGTDPDEGVSILSSALMNVISFVGEACGYPPQGLEAIVFGQLCQQMGWQLITSPSDAKE